MYITISCCQVFVLTFGSSMKLRNPQLPSSHVLKKWISR